jgi:hypothetical protein
MKALLLQRHVRRARVYYSLASPCCNEAPLPHQIPPPPTTKTTLLDYFRERAKACRWQRARQKRGGEGRRKERERGAVRKSVRSLGARGVLSLLAAAAGSRRPLPPRRRRGPTSSSSSVPPWAPRSLPPRRRPGLGVLLPHCRPGLDILFHLAAAAGPTSSSSSTPPRALLLVEIGPKGWTPTQQPPEFSPFLRSLSQCSYFYLGGERRRRNLMRLKRK